MSSPMTEWPHRPSTARLAFATILAGALSLATNLAIARVGQDILGVSEAFQPYQSIPALTISAVVLGAVLFWVLSNRAKHPRRTFIRIALAVLLLSVLPDGGLLVGSAPGATVRAVGSLMAMHVATALIVVSLLLRVGPVADER